MINLTSLSVDFDGRFQLHDVSWEIKPGQHWLITGGNGSGKSALAAVLAGEGDVQSGTLTGLPARVALVSYERQAELIAAELRKDDADILDVIWRARRLPRSLPMFVKTTTLHRPWSTRWVCAR